MLGGSSNHNQSAGDLHAMMTTYAVRAYLLTPPRLHMSRRYLTPKVVTILQGTEKVGK